MQQNLNQNLRNKLSDEKEIEENLRIGGEVNLTSDHQEGFNNLFVVKKQNILFFLVVSVLKVSYVSCGCCGDQPKIRPLLLLVTPRGSGD